MDLRKRCVQYADTLSYCPGRKGANEQAAAFFILDSRIKNLSSS